MAFNQLQVGIQNNPDSTNPVTARGGKQGDSMVSELHGRYYEQAYRGSIFNGGIVAQVTSAGLNATYTGLCLSNPLGSSMNLVLNKVGYAFTVIWAAVAAIGLATGFHASTNVVHTAAVTPRSQFFTGAVGIGKGLLDSSATLPVAPTVNTFFNAASTATAAIPPLVSGLVDMEGSIVLPPGAFCIFYTSTASGAAGGHISFSWEEVPV